jgi:REP element-mobilizing transposase RayT
VTFRLAGSLPQQLIGEMRERVQQNHGVRANAGSGVARLPVVEVEKVLDAGYGPQHLARPEVAAVVASALQTFDGIRYKLFAWCTMPNHVHVVFQPLGDRGLADILHSWKSFTAREAQRKFGINGAFWQREYYDHWVRDEEQFLRAVRYVEQNPARAGLEEWRWVEVAPR